MNEDQFAELLTAVFVVALYLSILAIFLWITIGYITH